ncbi:hypothetical protein GH714_030874 [Hevea brasiliensis]|uniref:Uncharacterized protein n=1 Tax=Hevea brasiliensis TaxID=3981 RepID=A0A6A6N8B2_HEVBR|nr:hypothetical protein GH714_030874 [Hevea brasiliensis]
MVVAISRGSKVKSLPGYGDLPLTLETGYIGVGEKEEVQLFYYFVKSENNPKEDPVVLWINGGPGCSSLGAFFFENGLNIIFLDAPIGTGFSYSKTTQGYNTSDSKSAANTHEFIQKWFKEHPSFLENPLYLLVKAILEKHIPVVIQKILTSNEAGIKPIINVKAAYASCNGTFYPCANTEDCNALLSYINEGAISTWLYCNDTLNSVYGRDIESVIAYHQNFSKTNLRDTHRKFENGDFSLTYATVKGAGHFAAKFKPQCSAMIARWMAYESL